MNQNFDQLKLHTRAWLQGAEMHTALRAVNLGLEWHDGTRKDGVTHEFTHQLAQIQMARTLASVNTREMLETLISVIALHDLVEDKRYDQRHVYTEFGTEVGGGVERMSKKVYGQNAEKSSDSYYYDIGLNLYASIAKGLDRVHNQSTAPGVLKPVKLFAMLNETEAHVLPMLKEARKRFPAQERAYSNLRTRLKEQIHLIRTCLALGVLPEYQKPTSD